VLTTWGVTQGGLRLLVLQTILPDCHRRTDLVEQCSVVMPKRMESVLWNSQLRQQRMKLPLPNEVVIPRTARLRCKEQAKRIRSPASQVVTEMFDQLRGNREAADCPFGISLSEPGPPYALANLNDGIFQVQVNIPQRANLTAADSALSQN